MDAGKRSLNDIFNGNRILEIPFFQRAYVWDEEQWERLLEDMENVSKTNKPYFLGSIILKQQGTNTGNKVGDRRTLIDGQQRLTTLSIFFKVYALKTGDSYSFDRMFQLREAFAIQHNHNDIESYEKILELKELKDISENDNISRAYKYFKSKLDITKIDLDKILTYILFVGIDLDKEEDEQQIFDTINSIGVKLTTAELLKNYFFNRDEISSYENYWKDIFEKDEETKEYWDKEITAGRRKRAFIDLFFFSYLQIKIQDKTLNVKTDDKIQYSKVEHLFISYKDFIKNYLNNDQKSILPEIKDYASIFRKNFNYEIIEQGLTAHSGIERINAIIFGLDTSTLIPYTLFALKNVTNDTQRKELFQYLEAYIMRRMVVHASTKNYNRFFTESLINNKILSKNELIDFIDKQDDKVNYFPKDNELERGFNESRLINKQAAGILYFIESKIRNNDYHSTQLLGIDKYSLEHLMPKKWRNHWEHLDTEEENIKRDRKLLTLGNLSIITQKLNTSIRDAKWSVKLEGRKDNKGLKTYASGLDTMTPYLSLNEWNEKEIEKRSEFLFEKAKEIWSE